MFFSRFRAPSAKPLPRRKVVKRSLALEALEERTVPATYTVVNPGDAGAGTLRQAILDANTNPGADLVDFNMVGSIQLTSALPAITGQVDLRGGTAPGYAGTPLVEIDFNQFAGLQLGNNSDNSAVRSLAFVDASGAAISANGAGQFLIVGNYIGLSLDGTTVAANTGSGLDLTTSSGNTIGGETALERNVISGNLGHGILITNSSTNVIQGNYIGTDATGTLDRGNLLDGVKFVGSNNNLIGHSDPVTSVTYYNADGVTPGPVSGWQGLRGADTDGQYLISGTSGSTGLLFEGSIAGSGTSYSVNRPGASSTSVYGPDNLAGDAVRLVGSYRNADSSTAAVKVHGFLFEGTTAQLTTEANYRTIEVAGAEYNYVHSTNGGFAVGNNDAPLAHGTFTLPLGPGHAFLYDVATATFVADMVYPGSISNTAYGIWHNGGTSYTIVGGYTTIAANNFDDPERPIGQGYIVDYDSQTGVFSHWTTYNYPNGINFVTHFEGISSVEKGVYTLNADSVQDGSTNPTQGSWVTVRRNTDGSFGPGTWVDLDYPSDDPSISSSDAVFGNQVVGIVIGTATTLSFQATINIGFQLSNVISGNGGNGITLDASSDNQIAMNYIGTDVFGAVDIGNSGNGILVTNASARNRIGGEATGGNKPTGLDPVFVRPPQGNLISGNDAAGVLINGASTLNLLAGNFIGTDAPGSVALGNALDGVTIDNADGNQLIGCTFQQDPFVFYNVISGNGGNGLRIHDSDNTTVQANFFGMDASNSYGIGNGLNGVLLHGSSANTQFGGVIPLGNVVVANGRNGIELADTVSGTVIFNTFGGVPAFKDYAIPNVLDGILVTSTGGNNLIRTSIISGNGSNGIHLSGNASGVQISEVIIGMNTNGIAPIPNGANGVLIDGTAHDNRIGGEEVSIVTQNTISGNGANGVAIVGNAYQNSIFHSFIGADVLGLRAIGNGGAGIFIGGNASGTVIGGTGPEDKNVISGNQGAGIQLSVQAAGGVGLFGASQVTLIIGNLIGTDRNGQLPLGNRGSGIASTSSNNQIGGSAAGEGNTIAYNLIGVLVDTGTSNGIHENSIFSNSIAGIFLANNGNLSQVAPVMTGAFQPTSDTIQLSGTLIAAANTAYTVEVFASPTSTPGQGQTFLGVITVLTNSAGVAPFIFGAAYSSADGGSFTATASDPGNNTSAFSAAIGLQGNANTQFVSSAYGLLLSRVPDGGATMWVDALNNGASPSSVVLGIESSAEYLNIAVNDIYLRYLDRGVDPTGQQTWVTFLQSGGTLEQVAEGVVSSPEYFQDQGSTNAGYVTALYNEVLGRQPSEEEVAGWVAALDAGATRDSVAIGFLTSTEYRSNLVESDYQIFLGRAADPDGLSNWIAAMQAGTTDQEVLAGIFGSTEGYEKWS